MTKNGPRVLLLALLASAVGLACPLPARAAESASPGKIDRAFLIDAASGGMAEVELGRYATTHAASDAVKQFGQRMVDDHSKVNAELKQVAARKSVNLPATLTEEHREKVSGLMKLHGAEFDRAYMAEMVRDHQEDVAKFRDEARRAEDPDLKEFATKALPTLEEHLQMAKDVSARAGSATSGTRSHAD